MNFGVTTLRLKFGLQIGELSADLISLDDFFGACPKPPDLVSLFPCVPFISCVLGITIQGIRERKHQPAEKAARQQTQC